MKKLLFPLALLVAGAGVGSGAAVVTRQVVGPKPAHAAPVEVPLAFVPVTKVIAPLVLGDGRLAGYLSFDAELQVAETAAPDITAKLPLLLHAINMRTYKTPLATGRDGLLPDIGELRKVVDTASKATFGSGTVRRVAITRAEPA